jgi:hypothetical protein
MYKNCGFEEKGSSDHNTVKLGYSNIGFCDTLSIASNCINIVVLIIQRYSFITTLFLGPFDDVITKFYCICYTLQYDSVVYGAHLLRLL